MGAIAYKGKIYGGGGNVEDLKDVEVTNIADGDILEYDAETEKWKNSNALSGKVDKVAGKGLSTNDYTDSDKDLVATIPDKADSDDISGVKNITGNPLIIEDSANAYAEEMIANIEPIQDLHGYDKPWVGGAGKNLLPMTVDGIKAANTEGTWNGNAYTLNSVTFTIQTDSDGNVTGINANGTAASDTELILPTANNPLVNTIISGCPSNGSNTTYFLAMQQYNGSEQWGARAYDYGSGQTYGGISYEYLVSWITIKSGYNASGLIFKPMIRLATETDASFAPYTNMSSIIGQTEVVIGDVGKNLFDGQFESGYYDSRGEVYSLDWKRSADYINVVGGQSYVLSGELETLGTHSSNGIFFYAEDGSYIAYALFDINALTFSKSVVAPQNCTKIGFYVRVNANIKYIQIEEATTPTTYEPYKGKIYRVEIGQKNKWNFESYLNAVKSSQSNFTWSESNGEYTISNHNALSTYGKWKFSDYDIPITISLKTKGNGGQGTYIIAYDKNDNVVGEVNTNTVNTEFRELSLTAICSKLRISYANAGSMIYKEPMIRSAIDDSEFVPYNLNLPSAIYGGKLNVQTGELVVERASVDLGSLEWTYDSGNVQFYSNVITDVIGGEWTVNCVCSCYEVDTRNAYYYPVSHLRGFYNRRVHIVDTRYTDATAFKTAVTGQTLVYELATPITYHLTHEQIKLLKGYNYITTNAETLDVTYQPDNVLGEILGEAEGYTDRVAKKLSDELDEVFNLPTGTAYSVNLKTYTWQNTFECPKDGIVNISIDSGETGMLGFGIYSPSGAVYKDVYGSADHVVNDYAIVKKGMGLYHRGNANGTLKYLYNPM